MSQLAKQTNASAQTKRRRVQIDEVDVASNTITGKDQYGLTFQITYGPYYDGNVIVIPKQGENWIVEQYRQEWRLKYKAEDLTSFVNFTLAPGDKLIDSGTLWINGNANLTNGYLTINDPTSAQHAATKNYVDTHGGGGAVDSVFGRAGIVTAQTGDYTVAQITGAAPLASPTFTGTVTAPTPSIGDDSTIVPTTHWVRQQGYITGSVVTSVFSRTGAVTAQTGDYTVAQITGAAPIASPTFTGIPAAPTPATADNSTTVATTAFVKNQGYVTAATSPVTSVFTRTGAVVAASGDYTLTQIGKGTQHALAISGATVMASLATGSSGQLLQSGGASADPAWTASTYPGTAGGIGHVPRSDGTNYVDAQLAATDLSNGTVGLGNIVLANGPALTNPTATTQATADNSTLIATTAFVKAQGYLTSVGTVVNTFNGRSGAVAPASGDYTVSQVTGAAPLASPTFTGTPAAPTPASDSSDRLATTSFVWGMPTVINVKNPLYGALGDGTTDDTAALQNAITAAGAVQGTVFLPSGIYKITAPLVIPQEISLIGAGRFSTTIRQYTNNTQILKVTDANSASVRLSDFALAYATQQTSASHPNSYAIAFMGTVEQGNVYYWTIERLQISQATVGIGELSSLSTYYFWGNYVNNIYLTKISQSLIDTTATRFHGNPHNYFGKIIHLVSSTPAPTGPALKLSGEFTLEGADIEDWTNQLIWAEGHSSSTTPMPAAIRNMHVERHSITQASSLNIIQLQNGKYTVEELDYQTGTGSGTAFAHNLVNTNAANLRLSNVTVYDWGATGTLVIHNGLSTDQHVVSGIADALDTGVSTGSIAKQVSLENGTVAAQNLSATQSVQSQRSIRSISALTYGATVATDASLGEFFTLTVGNTTAFTISNPTNLSDGQIVTYDILNGSGGVMGAITWGTNFRLAGAFTNPANNKRRTISFYAHAGFLIELNRAAADI